MSNALDDALKPLAATGVALLKSEFDSLEPALAASAEKSGATLINAVKAKIEGALPTNGIIANLEKTEIDPVLDRVAAALVAQLPAGVNYLDTLIDGELATIEKNLAG